MVAPARRLRRSRLLPVRGSVPSVKGGGTYSTGLLRAGAASLHALWGPAGLRPHSLPAGWLACWPPWLSFCIEALAPIHRPLLRLVSPHMDPCSLDLYCLSCHPPPLGTLVSCFHPPPILPVAPSQEAAQSPHQYMSPPPSSLLAQGLALSQWSGS